VAANQAPMVGLLRLVEVARHLHGLADLDLDARLLERLARRGLVDVLAPLDEAAWEAPAARPELPRPPLHEQDAATVVADDARRPDPRVGEEEEAAAGARRPLPPAAHDAPECTAAPRARRPVVAEHRHVGSL
jgi:hypothetical protein